MFKKILVAIDEGGPAARAVEVAIGLAEQLGARLAVLHVVDSARAFVPEMGSLDHAIMHDLRRQAATLLNVTCGALRTDLEIERMLLEGEPAECIVSTAKQWDADLVVIGSDSRGRLAHFLLGSTADSVIRRATCPVITVRMGAAIRRDEVKRTVATA